MLPGLQFARSIDVTTSSARLRAIALDLLARRASDGTICPSEVARAATASTAGADVSRDAWREAMPAVHDMVDRLVADGVVRLSWKGTPLPARAGPYRIGRNFHR